MILTMMFLLGSSTVAAVPQDVPRSSDDAQQSVNGGEPQRVNEERRSREKKGQEHWNDGMNTKRAPDPRKRDEYGAPKVTPPKGQGTDNAGGLPPEADRLKSKP